MNSSFANRVDDAEEALSFAGVEPFTLALDAIRATSNETFKIYRTLAIYSVELFDLAHVGCRYLRFIEALPEHSYFITNKDKIEDELYSDYRYLDVLRKRYRDDLRNHGFHCACSYDTPESALTVERLLHKLHDCKYYRDLEFLDGEILPDGVPAETARKAKSLLTNKVLNRQAKLFSELLRLSKENNILDLGVDAWVCQNAESRNNLRMDCDQIASRWVDGGEQEFTELFLEEIRSVIVEVESFLKEVSKERKKMIENRTPLNKYFYDSDNSDDNIDDQEYRYHDDRNVVSPPDLVLGEDLSDDEKPPPSSPSMSEAGSDALFESWVNLPATLDES